MAKEKSEHGSQSFLSNAESLMISKFLLVFSKLSTFSGPKESQQRRNEQQKKRNQKKHLIEAQILSKYFPDINSKILEDPKFSLGTFVAGTLAWQKIPDRPEVPQGEQSQSSKKYFDRKRRKKEPISEDFPFALVVKGNELVWVPTSSNLGEMKILPLPSTLMDFVAEVPPNFRPLFDDQNYVFAITGEVANAMVVTIQEYDRAITSLENIEAPVAEDHEIIDVHPLQLEILRREIIVSAMNLDIFFDSAKIENLSAKSQQIYQDLLQRHQYGWREDGDLPEPQISLDDWKKDFYAKHDIKEIPDDLRRTFLKLIDDFALLISSYSALKQKDYSDKILEAPSPHDEAFETIIRLEKVIAELRQGREMGDETSAIRNTMVEKNNLKKDKIIEILNYQARFFYNFFSNKSNIGLVVLSPKGTKADQVPLGIKGSLDELIDAYGVIASKSGKASFIVQALDRGTDRDEKKKKRKEKK